MKDELSGKIVIGADSAGSNAWMDVRTRKDKKVFVNGKFVIGCTDSFRMIQLLTYAFTPPAHDPSVDTMRYMVTDWINAVRQCFKDGGFAEKEKEVESGGTFLVGYQGRLFAVQGNYQVAEFELPYAAVGCGADYALGVVYALNHVGGYTPSDVLLTALKGAELFSGGVRGPFHMLIEP